MTASRAAILGALLPAWEDNEALLRPFFPDQEAYRAWFPRMLGIRSDVAGQRLMDRARETGVRVDNPFNERGFRVAVDKTDSEQLRETCRLNHGVAETHVLDPMAGGGASPSGRCGSVSLPQESS